VKVGIIREFWRGCLTVDELAAFVLHDEGCVGETAGFVGWVYVVRLSSMISMTDEFRRGNLRRRLA
jgi:hypothetical protein